MRFVVLVLGMLMPLSVHAFCGFYVGGADAKLFNDATQVVLMREGTQTVLSMQNRYSGPPENFAMVIPVPVVLQEDDVKTLDEAIFQKIDILTAPRLVEYWEEDPCYEPEKYWESEKSFAPMAVPMEEGTGVKVEAEFKVGEYEIVILSAQDSTGLDRWLEMNEYQVPAGAAPYYQPYISGGMYFFVARVDASKVKFDDAGNVVLSPLRFSYTSEDFSLPIRLGMINSNGEQDLIIQILAKEQRYDLANYPNVFIPTNIEVAARVAETFGEFYKELFARTLKKNPGAAITEYSWDVSTCDPCPGDVTLDHADVLNLGGDLLFGDDYPYGMVVTRLHLRYEKDQIGEDLVFRKAPPVFGGRQDIGENRELIREVKSSDYNNFQGRYIIKHPWTGPTLCLSPSYGNWGSHTGPRSAPSPNTAGGSLAPSSTLSLEDLVKEDVPAIGLLTRSPKVLTSSGCSRGCSSGGGLSLMALLAAIFVIRRRRNQMRD